MGNTGPQAAPKSSGCPLVRAMTWGGPVSVSLLPCSLLSQHGLCGPSVPSLLKDRDSSPQPRLLHTWNSSEGQKAWGESLSPSPAPALLPQDWLWAPCSPAKG